MRYGHCGHLGRKYPPGGEQPRDTVRQARDARPPPLGHAFHHFSISGHLIVLGSCPEKLFLKLKWDESEAKTTPPPAPRQKTSL